MKMKNAFSWMAAGSLLMGLVGGAGAPTTAMAASAVSFSDVKPSAWYYASVEKLASKGLVNGCGNGLFCPSRTITRAEFIKMTDSALGLTVGEAAAGQAWHVPFIQAAVSAGVHKTSDFNGNWSQPISRQEMARLVVRAVDEKLRQAKTTDPQLVYEATKRGILSGLSGGELGLKESSTRAQASVIIDRMLTLLDGGTLPMDKRAASYAEVAYTGTNVETMWGGKFRQLPFKAKIRNYINGEFKQILILDMDDKDSPYRSWLPRGTFDKYDWRDPRGIIKTTDAMWEDEYMMAFRVKLSNTQTVKNLNYQFRDMIGAPYFLSAIAGSKSRNEGPFATELDFSMSTINSKEIWVFYAIKKETVKEAQQFNAKYFYFESFGDDRYKLLLGDNGKLFGGRNE